MNTDSYTGSGKGRDMFLAAAAAIQNPASVASICATS